MRFEELRPDPLRIPPNAASRALDRVACSAVRSRTRLRALAERRLRLGGPRQAGAHERRRRAVDREPRVLPVSGWAIPARADRHARRSDRDRARNLDRIPGGSEFEIEFIGLAEVDAEGKLRAVIRFDSDDRAAAFEEAERRFLAGEAAATADRRLSSRCGGAITRRDWEAMRRCFADDGGPRSPHCCGLGRADRRRARGIAARDGRALARRAVETVPDSRPGTATGRVAIDPHVRQRSARRWAVRGPQRRASG